MERFEVIVCNKCNAYVAAYKYPECISNREWNKLRDEYTAKGHYRVVLLEEGSFNFGECNCILPKNPKFGVIKRQDLIEGLTRYFADETDMFDDEADKEVKVIMYFLDEFMRNQNMQTELKF